MEVSCEHTAGYCSGRLFLHTFRMIMHAGHFGSQICHNFSTLNSRYRESGIYFYFSRKLLDYCAAMCAYEF